MRLAQVSQIPYSRRVGPYHFQMIQAKLSGPVQPIVGYSLQPFYTRQQQWMTDMADSLSQLYRYTAELSQAAKQFDPSRRNSVLHARVAVSSHPERAQAKAAPGAEPGSYQLDVIRLATQQTNRGIMAESSGPSLLPPGVYTFSLTIGQQENILAIQAKQDDSHEQLLKRLAGVIHQADLAASIEYSETMSRMVLRSSHTGAKHAFQLRDIDGAVVRTLGLDQVAMKASDAEYDLDGMRSGSPFNQVELSGKVAATLLQPGKASLVIQPDSELLLEKTRELVTRYNRLHAFVEERPNLFTTTLPASLEQIARSVQSGLADYGLHIAPNGQLKLDEETLTRSVERDFSAFVQDVSKVSQLVEREAGKWRTASPANLTGFNEEDASGRAFSSFLLPNHFYRQAVYTGLIINQLW
ncbi:flagellar cap protein FliD N-terminal domain-containing protein [Brevibacillus borstelensis]|uniref:flagellar cap protein FliD N-terminal domain-containing protein n=1 Tax=Brevibacillus borstelensis TaxID=45462 RepID=UPI00068C6655|nr:flagellar cap protein FliD N-terminal domain-containing protein [Brevibacillus borstelensis]